KMSPEEGWDKVSLAIEAKMDRLLEQRQLKWNMMRERQDQLILGAVQRDRQIGELQERLAAMSDLASLKEQLQHSTGSFLKKMEDVRELCENMFDLASEGLAKQSKELHELAMRWKNGIDDQNHRERGARKFLRSLSETASTRPGLTKLDDELDSLSALTGSAMDQSLHLAMLSRQALCELESGVQVAGLWLGLSMRENERERTCDWMECLLAAQKLVGAEARYSTLSFETLPRLASPEDTYPPVARVALVSGLFHLYMALLTEESLESIKSPILLRQKRLSDQGTMIFSLPPRANDVSEGDLGRGQAYHMELAKAILAPLKIRAAFLPPNFAGVPVALSWQLPVKSVDVTPERDVTHSVLGADC
ncbi:MAG: hypothetical protein NTV34_21530, partial [Proteobacteria bacterium]|nr:hypothetical protein [Pseudomonadota bacterium]